MSNDIEESMYRLKEIQAENRARISYVLIGAGALVGLATGYMHYEHLRRVQNPVTLESCARTCNGFVEEESSDECKCRPPPAPVAPQVIGPLKCTCQQ